MSKDETMLGLRARFAIAMALSAAIAAAIWAAFQISNLSWWPGRFGVLLSCILVGLAGGLLSSWAEGRASLLGRAVQAAALAIMTANAIVILGWFFVVGAEYLADPPPPTACSRFCD